MTKYSQLEQMMQQIKYKVFIEVRNKDSCTKQNTWKRKKQFEKLNKSGNSYAGTVY